MIDELVALANRRGGMFGLGVEDSAHEVIGIPVERLETVVYVIRADAVAPANQPPKIWCWSRYGCPQARATQVPW